MIFWWWAPAIFVAFGSMLWGVIVYAEYQEKSINEKTARKHVRYSILGTLLSPLWPLFAVIGIGFVIYKAVQFAFPRGEVE